MHTILQDLRQTFRRLIRNPGFSAVILLTLALAIGANVALFTVVNGVLLRPLPYPDSERIVEIRHHAPGIDLPELRSSPGMIEFYRESARSLGSVAATVGGSRNLSGGERAERVPIREVTPELFDVLAVKPALGRAFVEADAEEGAAPVTILTHGTWQSRFGGEPDIVGRLVEVGGSSTEVVGVMPPDFAYPDPETALFLPLRLTAGDFSTFGATALARLELGVDLDAARRELEAMQVRLPERFPEAVNAEFLENARWSVSADVLRERVVGDVSTMLWVLFGTVGLVLLIAGANVANLFLVRAEARRREMAVRAALGASGGRIARAFLAESVLLGLIAGGLGVMIANGGIGLLLAYGPVELLPRLHEIGLDARVLAFAVVLSLVAGLALGILPVPTLARQSASAVLHGGGRSSTPDRERHRARQLLIVGQVALALVLLVAAGLMLRSMSRLLAVDPGIRPDGVITAGVSLGENTERTVLVAFYQEVLEEIASLPGVTSVGATNSLPIDPVGFNGGSFSIEGRPTETAELPPVAMWHVVTDNYFETLGIPLLEGRAPTRADSEGGPPVMWVNETFARRYLDGSAVGERIRIGADTIWTEIVGVVGDVRAFGIDEEIQPMASLPMTTTAPVALNPMHLVLRTNGAPAAVMPSIRAAVERLDPSVPLTTARTMDEVVRASLAQTSFLMVLLAIAAVVALVLGVVGLYGVISYVVSLRRTEIGVRIALGARPATVRGMVLRQGLGLAIVGVAVGLLAAAGVTRVLASLLFEVSARDPVTFATVAVVLTLTSLAATNVPARRATRVDPMVAIRTE